MGGWLRKKIMMATRSHAAAAPPPMATATSAAQRLRLRLGDWKKYMESKIPESTKNH